MILGLVAVTLIVILVAVPSPKVVYPASAFLSPTPQVMQGGIPTTTTSGNEAVIKPDRSVILSNLIIMAQGGEVFLRALDFLAQPVEVQRRIRPDLPSYRQITRIEVSKGRVLSLRDWPDVLEVEPVQMPSIGEKGTTTDIIRITVKLQDPTVAPYLANAVGHAFAEVYQEKSREDTRKYAKFLEASLAEARSKLRDLQTRIAQYKGKHQVVAVDAESQSAISSIAGLEQAKSSAEAAVREAEAAVMNLNAQLREQPAAVREPLPGELNPTVQKLKEELADAEAQLRLLSQRYTPEHPTYKALQAHIDALKLRINIASTNYAPARVNEIRQDLLKKRSEAMYMLATARARLSSINASLARAQAKVQNLTTAEPELTSLIREYQQAENTYKLISDKLAQVRIAEKEFTRTGSIVPYDWARAAGKQVVLGPTRAAVMGYGFVLALIVGVAVAIWLDSIDTRMRNAADVEQLLQLPVLGLTPQLTGRDGVLPKLTHLYPLSAMAESYRILRTNVLFALRDQPFKTLMVATGRPGQGATTTICNLAIALAQIGKRIILIDADMRKPSLHRFFGVSNEVGLSTLLQGKCKLTDALRKTDIENLVVIPAGPQPMNPSELLGSDRMRELVEMLEEHCDLVLFDTPSTIVFSDGPMLASWIDAVIMVVSANQAPRGTETHTRDLLRKAKANILGVVVNRMQPEAVDSCYYYSHYYAQALPSEMPAAALGVGEESEPEADKPTGSEPKPKAIPAPETETTPESAEENPFPE